MTSVSLHCTFEVTLQFGLLGGKTLLCYFIWAPYCSAGRCMYYICMSCSLKLRWNVSYFYFLLRIRIPESVLLLWNDFLFWFLFVFNVWHVTFDSEDLGHSWAGSPSIFGVKLSNTFYMLYENAACHHARPRRPATPVSRENFGHKIGWDPSDSKSNRLHVDIFWFFFINLRCILYNPLEWWVIFLKSTGYWLCL